MNITPLGSSDDAAVEQWLALLESASRLDFPDDAPLSRRTYSSSLDHPEYGFVDEFYVARINGAVVGAVKLELPQLDNTDNALLYLVVRVDHRREGIGRALFDYARTRARELGRARIIFEVRETYPGKLELSSAALEFAQSIGATRALLEVRRRLNLSALDDEHLARLEADADAAAAGYRLVTWSDAAPDDLMDGLVVLESRMSTDAPMGDLAWGQESVDRDRLRAMEKMLGIWGRSAWNVAAVHELTGDVAGTTRIVADDDVPEQAWQWNTIVLPDHRGHRLGILMKLANLRQLRQLRPSAQSVDTWNAEDNPHMVSVNVAIGFEIREYEGEWQLDI